MTERRASPPPDASPDLAERVDARVRRRLKARRQGEPHAWFGLGMMGLIGWSVAVPTLLGAALGRWVDAHYPGQHSWTLALLVAGLVLGCANAWHWVSKEDHAMRRNDADGEDDDDDDGR